MTASNCANCEQEIMEVQHFCSNCGQKAHLHRLSWHDITHDAIHYFTHADKGIFHLLLQLATRTGTVAREFVRGKRKKYFPPFNFFLVVAAIYVFMSTFGNKTAVPADTIKEHPELNYIADPVKREHVLHIYERAATARSFMNKHSNTVAMLALPLIAFIFWLFYRRAGYNYIEHLVSNMYMSGFTLLCQVIVFIPLGKLFHVNNSNYILIAFFIFQLIYFTIFYYRFINRSTTAAGFKAFFVSLFTILFWVMLTGGLIRAYITTGFWGLVK